MKIVLLVVSVMLLSWVQVIYPAQLAPWHLVPATALLVTYAVAIYYEPRGHAVWYALTAGLSVDLWQPSHFGTWSLACLVVVLMTQLVHTRLLPRQTWLSVMATAAIALGAGELIVVLREGIGLSFGDLGANLLRFWLPRLIFDLILVVPISYAVRSILVTLRVAATGKLKTDAIRR